MRLLHFEAGESNQDSVTLVGFTGKDIPRYGILSHTWGKEDEEVTFADMMQGTGQHKLGYSKIQFCGKKAMEDLQYLWIDTCCIDKSDNVALNDAINSMFRWYQNAAVCYVYLSDVSKEGYVVGYSDWEKSKWFKRRWTLHELIAPKTVEFYSVDGDYLGSRKRQGPRLFMAMGICGQALHGRAMSSFSVKERLGWAEFRKTSRDEDVAYCLLRFFDV
ncbi:HET-domain-containing protein [Lentithecium fluviatile CBS 122367]|uniref:HET-domain-containing protein n=1 Tax=Lentithecium fluviatile CBS 122367 TaxID=1168545 RepID=A0A6G1J3D2_9PLEO|nr:HET-domain-containing protein [Lentithecium fluviatile CBS 122367]